MQADLASWPTDVRGLALRPMRRSWEPDARSGARQRCQRCDIPLGSSLCPNPECREPHGQQVGDLCTWCYHNAEERADGIDCPPLSLIEYAIANSSAPSRNSPLRVQRTSKENDRWAVWTTFAPPVSVPPAP